MRLICLQVRNQDNLLSFPVPVTTFCGTFHLLNFSTRHPYVNRKIGRWIVALMSLLLIPRAKFQYYSMEASYIVGILFFVFLLFCLIATTISYFKVFRIIRCMKHKKSMFSILYILGVFYVSYSPFLVVTALLLLKVITNQRWRM